MKKHFLLIISLLFCFYSNAQEIDSIPKRKGIVSIDVHPNITKLVSTKFSEDYSDNYKIQLFYGGLNQAHTTLNKFNAKYSEWSGKILFETPNYKVWVGNYRTRLEADRALMKIRKEFPSAFIFKPKK